MGVAWGKPTPPQCGGSWGKRLPVPLGLGAAARPHSPAVAELVSPFQPRISAFPTSPSLPSPFCRQLSHPCRWMLYHRRISSSPITCRRLCRPEPPAHWTPSATAVLRQLHWAGAAREGPGAGWGSQEGGSRDGGRQPLHPSPAMRNPRLLCSLGAHVESRQRRGCFDWKRKNEQTTLCRFLSFLFFFFLTFLIR